MLSGLCFLLLAWAVPGRFGEVGVSMLRWSDRVLTAKQCFVVHQLCRTYAEQVNQSYVSVHISVFLVSHRFVGTNRLALHIAEPAQILKPTIALNNEMGMGATIVRPPHLLHCHGFQSLNA